MSEGRLGTSRHKERGYYIPTTLGFCSAYSMACKLLKRLKAGVGIEPTNKGFAVSKSLFI
jgi:hypothetical protein